MTRMSGGEAVAATLTVLGVTHVFGIVSVHNLPIYEALTRCETITVVRCRHEQGATHAADAYARSSGRLGVVLTSTGPGAVNAMAGLYEAQFGSSPVLMITGQADTRFYGKGKGFLHEAERQLDMLRTVTRRAETVRRTEDIAATVLSVVHDVRTGRPQPGAVEIPIDLQYREAEITIPEIQQLRRPEIDQATLERAATLLNAAERPLIWAGGGVVSAGASGALEAVATRLGAPVITTIEGRGALPEDHPLCLGPRVERTELAPVIGEADVVLAVGTRFQNYATRMWQLRIPGHLIHIDVDPGVIGRSYPAEIAIVADAGDALTALQPLLSTGNADPGFVDRARKSVQADLEQSREETGPDHWEIWQTIRRLLPSDAPIVRDSTVPAYLWGNRVLPVLVARTSIRPSSLAIGPGVPLAVGAAFGSGTRTLLIQGDGGLMLSLGELATMAEYQLPIIVCVFNDQGYGVLRHIQDSVMEHRFGVDLHTPDFTKIAEGMGLATEAVVGVDSFEPAFTRALERPGPTLLDIDMAALAPMQFPIPPHQTRRPT